MSKISRFILAAAVLILAAVLFVIHDKGSIAGSNTSEMSESQKKTLASIQRVDDNPLYTMDYMEDYGFDKYIKEGRELDSVSSTPKAEFACSTVYSFDKEKGSYFGRNMDWYKHPLLLLFTDPPNGNASVSMVDISYLGFKNNEDITKMTLEQRESLLYAPYIPFDGINEYGVCISEMTLSGSKTSADPNKVTLEAMEIMRAVLDYAESTREAIEIFQSYNVVYGNNTPPIHYMVADPSGESAVVEYIDGKLQITPNTNSWQICTNSKIYGNSEEARKAACRRYEKAYERLQALHDSIGREDVLNTIKDISVPSTIWTSMYDMDAGDIEIFTGRNFDTGRKFKIKHKEDME